MEKKPRREFIIGKSGPKQVVILEGSITFKFKATYTESEWKETLAENKDMTERELYLLEHGKAAAIYLLALQQVHSDSVVELWKKLGVRMHFSMKEEVR